MNKGMIKHITGWVFILLGLVLLLPILVAVIYKENTWTAFLLTSVISTLIGILCIIRKPKNQTIYAKEGFSIVALSWIIIAVMGALPFIISGEIPGFFNALFESASGFTTTGASVVDNVDALSKCILFWRSFMHWLGGMGVLVFIIAVIPLIGGGQNMHLMRAESPGPMVGKLMPKLRSTPMILYGIYFSMTVLEIIFLLLGGMPLFDAVLNSMATAGTGGFSMSNAGMSAYNTYCQLVISIFMILFGVNFNVYFLILGKKIKDVLKNEEVRYYLIILISATIIIAINISSQFKSMGMAFHHALFQVASIMTTTGFSSVDFNLWPELSKTILIILMFIGACAGSTGGGIKVSRFIIVCKDAVNELSMLIHPRRVKVMKMDGKKIEKKTFHNVCAYLFVYMIIFIGSLLLISLNNYDFSTNFSAVAATMNNIGPGLNLVGPATSYSFLSDFSKLVLSFDMIAGRLELFPILLLFAPGSWKK
ncbi:TrkH family potassium uptake protein [Anaerofustis stercorihominis]|uniref:TrkH family potassium uptake protein n=1 Tax=Anaerofustis stercorihominis TaxID=214853 RepID=UPI00214B6E43|nr:TrkH family potassium uptake protein [Anaerofustis stercorihominis]MCR2032334.1 TrkH family potassium uptake protein [Anaerofustis stercorihominis]